MKQKNSTYLYLGGVSKEKTETLRNNLNSVINNEFKEKTIKKYDMINALVNVGLKHQDEVLDYLPINKDILDKIKEKIKTIAPQ